MAYSLFNSFSSKLKTELPVSPTSPSSSTSSGYRGLRSNPGSTGNMSLGQFTPRLDLTFSEAYNPSNPTSELEGRGGEAGRPLTGMFDPLQEEAYWELGYDYCPLGSQRLLRAIKSLPAPRPLLVNSPSGLVFAPPINPVSGLGWADQDELHFGTPAFLPPPMHSTSTKCQKDELIRLGDSMRGHWVTDMSRSSNIDQQFKYLGLAYMKRSILSRIAIPISMFLEDQAPDGTFSNLHTWIHTPIGLRHINWSTHGDVSIDNDPDCGIWEGLVRAVSVYIPTMDRSVRALQRIMQKPKRPDLGVAIETRCVLPDAKEGKVLLFQIDTFPNAYKGDLMQGSFHTTRVLKFEHPVDNVKELTSKTALTESGSLHNCTRIQHGKNEAEEALKRPSR